VNSLPSERTSAEGLGDPSSAQFTRRHIQAAWAVHSLTASGVLVGYAGLHSVFESDARSAILWLVAALLLDAVDGPIARKLDVVARVPTLNGNSLDLIIDYFTCTIVPVAFLYRFDVLPDHAAGPIGFAILFVSALWMARTDLETADGWFNGFPAMWNMIIPTLFLIGVAPRLSVVICVAFCVLTLSRVQFAHPISVRQHRPISLVCMVLWVGSMTWLAIVDNDPQVVRFVLIVAPLWTVVQVLLRARANHVTSRALA